mmetsp:Transcript_14152/g.13681  ORF Transcript_14152/g.13681 Transcript_14152/m.13681 type:complete len:1212 (-) Transcript_14152:154-3789(-)|eukprot:CAMPEP_0119039432 /NCGR_PEP_ID=MMETSP1177-20130426/8911_1 /TAXON_ID=2985 /ORGANISM="Ochromonas sp, Strain CCMP1899" /LENGTH=1211 /DNA_ID=CAMNT_0007003297 /DNA_START=69 /DNA_END=3704 /DNA_ORIENTATION=+
MHIHEVIIDGFKSYAKRTVISGFDPQFNAITGLNGTGKSNILDSICFVLGISNLSQVRAGNLQELVYKQGQAGVTKASVTIVFNNPDPNNSPIGYDTVKQITVTRQIVIGGKNKYMINGKTVQQSEIQNMFHSVQLNVNNPHFLIMQGRITKVLNMKPVEILSMIEEAAGTKMFQRNKENAMKTIEKKQLKVDELSKCMDDEINPQLDHLREQQQHFTVYESNSNELDRLEHFSIASEYQGFQKIVDQNITGKKAIEDEKSAMEITQQDKTKESEECAGKIEEMSTLLKDEKKDEFTNLKKNEEDVSKELVKVKTLLKNHKETVTAEKETAIALERQVDGANESLLIKEGELLKSDKELEKKETEATVADKEATNKRDRHQNALAGVADESSADVLSLPEQVATWEKKAREAQSQLQQGSQRSDHAKKQLKILKTSIKTEQNTHENAIKEENSLKIDINSAQDKLSKNSYDKNEEESLRQKSTDLTVSSNSLQDEMVDISTKLEARLNFNFQDPEKGFDRSKIKGLVGRLINVNNPDTAVALEIAAGGKLFNLVVDTEQTGKLLLQKGGLKSRVTILPLNKINNRCVDPVKVQFAKDFASSKHSSAHLALELIGFDQEVKRAMEHTFGNVIVCDNSDTAKEIAFHKNVRTKTVTHEGDVYDPSGTMTGGANKNLGNLLSRISDLSIIKTKLEVQLKELAATDKLLERIDSKAIMIKDIEGDIENKRYALTICQEKLAESHYMRITVEVENLENQLLVLEEDSKSLKDIDVKASDELKRLKDTEKYVKKQRETAMKELEVAVKKSQKGASLIREELVKCVNKRDGLFAEVAGLKKDMISQKEQLVICTSGLERYEQEVKDFILQLDNVKLKYEEAKKLKTEKEIEISECSLEIKNLQQQKNRSDKICDSVCKELSKIALRLAAWEKTHKDAKKNLEVLSKKHTWIEREKEFFGRKGSEYDFEARDVVECQNRLDMLQEEQKRLEKKINKKVQGMLESAEGEFNELNKKKQIIVNDKLKIEAVIEELDIKKAAALQTTWVKVNRDFGSIFTMLLPGTHAKLEPPEGGGVADGLEVRVAFNGVWKDSLTELSGGQRSLLALSLILSLLLFKPAPMYILDEVDAALDLSHTQNIGMMLRTHFSASQFIVVSLKEGMFNNANVIFRTRFIDGVSAVTRTVVGGKNRNNQLQIEDDDEEENIVPKKKGKTGTKITKI